MVVLYLGLPKCREQCILQLKMAAPCSLILKLVTDIIFTCCITAVRKK